MIGGRSFFYMILREFFGILGRLFDPTIFLQKILVR